MKYDDPIRAQNPLELDKQKLPVHAVVPCVLGGAERRVTVYKVDAARSEGANKRVGVRSFEFYTHHVSTCNDVRFLLP